MLASATVIVLAALFGSLHIEALRLQRWCSLWTYDLIGTDRRAPGSPSFKGTTLRTAHWIGWLPVLVCPTAMVTAEGAYPTPKVDGTAGILRNGTCPTGYVGLGRFCEALHKDTPVAFPKIKGEPCPSGTFSTGRYCKAFR
ncbi:hypothetical protein ACVIGB_000380 [Bradyrhizobium sp. USDA 4341]